MTPSQIVLAHEDTSEFESILMQYERDYQPANTHERFLVETMAQARWRIARFRRLETAALDFILGAADPEAPDTKLAQSLAGKDGDPITRNRALHRGRRTHLLQNPESPHRLPEGSQQRKNGTKPNPARAHQLPKRNKANSVQRSAPGR